MNRVVLTIAFLLAVAVPAFAIQRTVLVVDDVIRMTNSGMSDDDIIAFVKKSPQPFEVNGDDVLAMNEAHVSAAVLKFVIDESNARMKQARSDTRDRVVERRVYAPHYDNDPFYYGYGWGYDPFWYGPRLGFGFGFGPRFGFGFHGRFRHH